MSNLKITFFTILLSLNLFSQSKENKFSLSGSVDAYFQTYLSSSDDNFTSFPTSFADKAGFALGMANLVVSYESGKVGAVADLAYGPRGNAAVGADVPYINQLYAYWNVSEKTKLTIGRFNTYLGYEVISPIVNFNYSTSYLFSNGPFSHVGLKADFNFSDDLNLMFAIMNPTDTNNNLTGDYAVGAQIGFKEQYLNFYYDSGIVLGFEVDYTGLFDISKDFFLGINAAYQENDGSGFYGMALYPQFSTSDNFDIGLRGEYFGLHGNSEDNVLGLTLTGSYTVEDLTLKPEVRLDSWDNATPFLDTDDQATNKLSAFTLAAIYKF